MVAMTRLREAHPVRVQVGPKGGLPRTVKSGGIWEVVRCVAVQAGAGNAASSTLGYLSAGSLIKALERTATHFRYSLITGVGPASGWVGAELLKEGALVKFGIQRPAFPDPSQMAPLKAAPEDVEKALRMYGRGFGVPDNGAKSMESQRMPFPWSSFGTNVPHQKQQDGIIVSAETAAKAAQEGVPAKAQPERPFTYAGSLDQHPPCAKFDIRDQVCLRVGGFMHGQVVRDVGGKEYVVVGVKLVRGPPQLWFHPVRLGRPGACTFPGATAAALRSMFSVVEQPPEDACQLHTLPLEDFDAVEDSDGEEILLCRRCHLPVGGCAYAGDNGARTVLHAECRAELMLHEWKSGEEARRQKEAALKKARRAEYDIGWSIDRVPRNVGAISKLGCGIVPQGTCCLVLNHDSRTVSLAATMDPRAAVNLEYLSLALQVRLHTGREPFFSLDAVDAMSPASMQEKRFEPKWLAGTSVGDVLFQADYYLKELSMGEYAQPVVGMRSCHDLSEEEAGHKDWNAREWFVVRKAEIQLSGENILMPYCKMGVEAREQLLTAGGLEDARITRPDHPLVKYAEAFTHNFDLIAERKSAIFHLRELAKTSILAKYLTDAEVFLEDAWYNLADAPKAPGVLKVPQLWNERLHSQIHVQDGEIVNAAKSAGTSVHGVYGGVEFGLERFDLIRPRVVGVSKPGMMLATSSDFQSPVPVQHFKPKRRVISSPVAAVTSAPAVASAPVRAVSAGPSKAPVEWEPGEWEPQPRSVSARPASRPRRISASRPASRVSAPTAVVPAAKPVVMGPMRVVRTAGLQPRGVLGLVQTGRVGVMQPMAVAQAAALQPMQARGALQPVQARAALQPMQAARGVDLNLDSFDLSTPVPVPQGGDAGAGVSQSLEACVAVGDAFWSALGDDSTRSVFKEDDRSLLKSVFNPSLTDRREEGDRFVPPDTNFAHVQKLRSLVKEEELIRERRLSHFSSIEFSANSPGTLFPSSWMPSFEIAHGLVREHAPGATPQNGKLIAHPEYKAEEASLGLHLKSAVPVFDKTTEDGISFRIYRCGSLEIRTTQEPDKKEAIGAVFSICESADSTGSEQVRYIGAREKIVKAMQYVERACREDGQTHSSSYVVLKTEGGSCVVTEKLPNGAATWEENPKGIEYRNSLAKVVRSASCRGSIVVEDVKQYKISENQHAENTSSNSKCKRYAQGVYNFARGAAHRSDPSFRKQWTTGEGGWQGPKAQMYSDKCSEGTGRTHCLACFHCGAPRSASKSAGRMGVGANKNDWLCPDCVVAWEKSSARAASQGGDTAKGDAACKGLELVLKLRFPSGDLEPILVGPSNNGIVVLTKMLPLKKAHAIPEDMQLLRPDGQELRLDQPIHAQGLGDGAILSVQGRA